VGSACPALAKYARRGVAEGSSHLPGLPTKTRPGSEAKLAVLMERAQQGTALFHPSDATLYKMED